MESDIVVGDDIIFLPDIKALKRVRQVGHVDL